MYGTMRDMARRTTIIRVAEEDHAAFRVLAEEAGMTMVDLFHEAVLQVRPNGGSSIEETQRAQVAQLAAGLGALEERVDVVESAVERFQSLVERSGSGY